MFKRVSKLLRPVFYGANNYSATRTNIPSRIQNYSETSLHGIQQSTETLGAALCSFATSLHRVSSEKVRVQKNVLQGGCKNGGLAKPGDVAHFLLGPTPSQSSACEAKSQNCMQFRNFASQGKL